MKHISNLLNVECLESARAVKMESNSMLPECTHLVDQIFIKFALLCRDYDAFYADRKRENAEKLQWTLAFSKLKILKRNQIQGGLDMTERHKWGKPPQLGQFLEWCTASPESTGFPELEEAYKISIEMNRQFSHYRHQEENVDLVIRHVIRQIGTVAYRGMSATDGKKAFSWNYEKAMAQFSEGKLRQIPKALEDKSDETAEMVKKQEVVKDEFKGVKRESAFAAMRNMLR